MTHKQLHKKTKFYKRPLFIVPVVIVIIIIAIIVFTGGEKEPVIDYVEAIKGELIQEVSVTGRVEPAESVDLSFETSGRVSQIFVDIGDTVTAGQELLRLNNSDIQALLNQAQAGVSSAVARADQYQAQLDTEQIILEEMKRGTRLEELQITQTSYNNAEKALNDAENNLTTVQNKIEVNLQNVYSDALTAMPAAANYGKSALITLSDIQAIYFNDYLPDSINLANAKEDAVYSLLGQTLSGNQYQYAGRIASDQLSKLNGGAYGMVQEAITENTPVKTEDTLRELLIALNDVKYALDTIVIKDSFSAQERTNLDSVKNNVSAQIVSLSSKQQLINAQKVTNENLISAAEAEVTYAKNTLALSQSELDLKKAGYTQDQIKAQESKINQAKANLASQKASINQAYASVQQYRAQIEKTILRAPINGVITKMEAQIGEIVFPSSSTYEVQIPLISIIGEGNFEMEANIAEVDIAKIKIGNTATVTLDAYNDVEFSATVTFVDPAETYVEGIPTYRVKLQFDEQDKRIKSGMTANIDILTAKKEDAVIIPQRAVITKEGEKIVRIYEEIPKEHIININEVGVVTGLRGSDGRIEILEGVKEGDKVVTSITNGE